MNDTISLEQRLRSDQMRRLWQQSCRTGGDSCDEQFAGLLADQGGVSVVAAEAAMRRFFELGSSRDPRRAAMARVLLSSFLNGQLDLVDVKAGELIWAATTSTDLELTEN